MGKKRKTRAASAAPARKAPATTVTTAADRGATASPATSPPAPARAPAGPAAASLGKQRRAAQRKEREAHAHAPEPAEQPAFFFGFEVRWAKLVLARVVIFALLALDAVMQISHAPRYGAGGFNVPHLWLLEPIAPGRDLFATAQLVIAYLLVLAACGVATRVVLPIATVLYGWLYFSSQLDSYQHHYLVFLLLALSCAVPWQRPIDATPSTPVRSWALRLILIELGIMYLWAAVSKMNSTWLDGRPLSLQMTGAIRSLVDSTLGVSGAAWFVMLVEVALAATIWFRRGWLVAAPLGLALHVGILRTGLEIGLFAELMLGIYILVVPDQVWVWLADQQPMRALRSAARLVASWFHGSMRFAVWVVAAGGGAVLAMLSRFDHGPGVGLWLVVALIVGTVFAVVRHRTHVAWLALAHLLALLLWTAADRATSTAMDYYRFWGGSSRRLGDVITAERAYRKMTEVAPEEGNGFYQLGRLLLARGAADEGLAALHRAQDLEPLRARSYVAEARWLAAHGRRDEAIEKAREATLMEPSDTAARGLLDSLLAGRQAPADSP